MGEGAFAGLMVWKERGLIVTYLITLGYIVAAYLIFDRSTRQPTCLAQRLALASLGLALLSFATARFLLAYNIEQFWLFDMGHVSFWTVRWAMAFS